MCVRSEKKITSNLPFDLVFWLCPFGVVVFTHKTRTDFLCARAALHCVPVDFYLRDFIHRRVFLFLLLFFVVVVAAAAAAATAVSCALLCASCLSFFWNIFDSYQHFSVRIVRVRHYVTCGLTVLIGRAADWYWKYFWILIIFRFFVRCYFFFRWTEIKNYIFISSFTCAESKVYARVSLIFESSVNRCVQTLRVVHRVAPSNVRKFYRLNFFFVVGGFLSASCCAYHFSFATYVCVVGLFFRNLCVDRVCSGWKHYHHMKAVASSWYF